jgi:hypothetical protein
MLPCGLRLLVLAYKFVEYSLCTRNKICMFELYSEKDCNIKDYYIKNKKFKCSNVFESFLTLFQTVTSQYLHQPMVVLNIINYNTSSYYKDTFLLFET